VAPGAAAHVTVQPAASRPAELQRYRVIVPNERTSGATTGVDLKLPAGVTFALAEAVAGWRTRVVHRNGAIDELRWSARNPVRVGPIAWKALQRYEGGDVVRWIGGADSEQPAPVTTLSEHAVPVDVVSTHGEPAAPLAGAVPGETIATERPSERDALTLAIAIVGAALGAAALAVALVRRRR
jgi:uncharacterized protein YcnI